MASVFDQIEKYLGTYKGEGINHEQQPFVGELSLTKSIGSFALHFKATGKDGALYHEERTTIALAPNEKLALWSVNTNNPFMIQHDFKKSSLVNGVTSFVFGFNDPATTQAFREEITLELGPNGALGYKYAWGMPGEEFKPRSSVTMLRQG